ncbi:MAG: hypothetical protein U0R19_02215 [Bryobacteraceae bacterium]
MKPTLPVLLSLAALLAAQQHDDHDHGPATPEVLVAQLISASRERFRPVMTYRVDMRPRGNSWYEAKYVLPEAQSCRVFEQPQMRYVCEWGLKPKRDFAAFVKQYEGLLGQGWKRTDGVGKFKSVRFSAVERQRNGDWEIAETEAGIRLTIFAMPSPE